MSWSILATCQNNGDTQIDIGIVRPTCSDLELLKTLFFFAVAHVSDYPSNLSHKALPSFQKIRSSIKGNYDKSLNTDIPSMKCHEV